MPVDGPAAAEEYLPDPQILVGGIGDATCDRAPCRSVSSSPDRDRRRPRQIWLEGGGGGQRTESYELAMYFMARKTSIDCLEKRSRRGYLFLIGDEMPYPRVKRHEVAKLLGDRLRRDIPIEEMVEELALKYETWFIVPNLSSYYDDPQIYRRWQELLGQRVVRLERPEAIADLIATIIGISEGAVDLDGAEDGLAAAGRRDAADAVADALASAEREIAIRSTLAEPAARPISPPHAAAVKSTQEIAAQLGRVGGEQARPEGSGLPGVWRRTVGYGHQADRSNRNAKCHRCSGTRVWRRRERGDRRLSRREFSADLVVRYCGGSQAGRNVVLPDGRRHVFSQFGAGTLAGAPAYMAGQLVLDPRSHAVEKQPQFAATPRADPFANLAVHPRARTATALYHQLLE